MPRAHFVEHGVFTVHHFVVRKYGHKIFRPLIQRGKGQIVLMPLPMNRFALEILQRVVHPAHVPLEVETDPARFDRLTDSGKGGGLLGNH